MKYIGEEITGLPNRQLAAGKGLFVGDVQLDGMLHMAVLRSPYAHARIRGINTAPAEKVPGVVYVMTGKEAKDNMNPITESYDTAAMGAKSVKWYALCPDRARYVGEAVAAVVAAEDKYTARKAADLIEVDYEELPVAYDPEEAMKPGAPLVEPDWGDNIMVTRDFKTGDPDKAFAEADGTLKGVAKATGLDRTDVRRKNFIPTDEFPYPQVSGAMLDSGNYPEALRRVLEMIDYENFPKMQAEARKQGRYIGLGIGQELTPEGCSMPRSTMLSGYDGCTVRVNPSGQVTVLTGVTSPGSGNETGIAQIVADTLGADLKNIKVIQGDTDTCPYGLGNYSSRSIIMGGAAAQVSATEIRDKMFKVAAKMLEVSPADLDSENDKISVKGAPTRYVLFKDVASTVYRDCYGKYACDVEPGLEATRYFRHPNVYHQPEVQGRFSSYPSWPNGIGACIAEVDPDTGFVKILRYCAVHDAGKIINPLMAQANLHGGIAQGFGGAMYENLVYDEAGQLKTATFMDYTVPTAADLPSFQVEHMETPSPFNPLGCKGVGESGVTGPLGALCGAVENALPHLTLNFNETPLTPNRVWQAIQRAWQSAN